jgi:hypothetical protein
MLLQSGRIGLFLDGVNEDFGGAESHLIAGPGHRCECRLQVRGKDVILGKGNDGQVCRDGEPQLSGGTVDPQRRGLIAADQSRWPLSFSQDRAGSRVAALFLAARPGRRRRDPTPPRRCCRRCQRRGR